MRKAKTPERLPLPEGTVLLDVAIEDRAVPWKAPTVTRSGRSFKDDRLVEWQDDVRKYGELNRTIDEPYWGPVEVSVTARFAKGPLPDTTNLIKAVEDALQGVVFVNDKQVTRNSGDRTQAGYDLARIVVKAATPTEEAGDG